MSYNRTVLYSNHTPVLQHYHYGASLAKLAKKTKNDDILKRWTEYCLKLYNYRATGDSEVLNVPPATNNANHPILRVEVEAAVKSLNRRKSAGVDNIPAELLQQGGEAMVNALLIICNKIWRTGEWPTLWTQSLVITLPKNGNLQLCQNYRTISLISHSSKVLLKIILNRLKPEAEKIIAEEQAGFRPGHSTTEKIFNLRILCERYLQDQQDLYHVFIDFKKAFERVWHAALWASMGLCSLLQWQHRRLVQNYSRSKTGLSALTYSLQHIPAENHG